MTYREAVAQLYALGNEVATAKLGLDRVRALLHWLGDPQTACRFVHVAGTNGKGSVSAMIEAGLREAGVRSGLYTSPHLVEPVERIRIDGTPISEDEFAEAFAQVHRAAGAMMAVGEIDLHPTYFECVTAMAFLLFRRRRVEMAVMEVGLGGRLDATNVIKPELCVITPVDFDHQSFLGDSLEQIAAEKAGILKPGVPAIFARQHAAAMRVLEARATEFGIAPERAADAAVSDLQVTARGSSFRLNGETINCPLAGEHQVENAVVAATALRRLGYRASGIANTRWPGRLERIAERPDIILDGAHNLAGVHALAGYLRRFWHGRAVHLIYGVMRDKPVGAMTAELFPLAATVTVTAPANTRAMPADDLIRAAAAHSNIRAAPDTQAALELVRSTASPEDAIVITGSLFLVGEARALLVK